MIDLEAYKNLTPEQEAELVPGWAIIDEEDHWFSEEGDPLFKEYQYRPLLCFERYGDDAELEPHHVEALLPALAFFAANGRLPRRVQ